MASAQTQIVPEGELKGSTDDDVTGWNPSLSVSGSVNLVSNSNVVGQVEGTSTLFGLGLTGGADYIKGKSVIRTTLSISESFAKTPAVDRFIKNNDVVALESTYNYFVTSSLGGFGRVKLTTALFPARAVTGTPVDYIILPSDPGGAMRTARSSRLQLASGFSPVTVNESLGAFAEPIASKKLNLRMRAGFGGRHTFADGVLIQADDAATPEIELQELTDVHQAGFELFAGVTGKLEKGRVKYAAGASVLFPFINNDEYNRSAQDLMRFGLEAGVTVSVFDWMNVVYSVQLTVDPQLFPDGEEQTQLQNSLLLTFQYTLFDRKKGLAALKKAAAAKRAAKEKADAERRATEAIERAKKLEKELKEAKERVRKLKEEKNSTPPPTTEPTTETTSPNGTTPPDTTTPTTPPTNPTP